MTRTYDPISKTTSGSSVCLAQLPASTNNAPVKLQLQFGPVSISNALRYSSYVLHLLSTNGWLNIPVGVAIPVGQRSAPPDSVVLKLSSGPTAYVSHTMLYELPPIRKEETLTFSLEQALTVLSSMKPTAFATIGRLPLKQSSSWPGCLNSNLLSPELRSKILATSYGASCISSIQKLFEATGILLTVTSKSLWLMARAEPSERLESQPQRGSSRSRKS